MTIGGRVGKVETLVYVEQARAVPCALHALGALQPDPKDPADQFAGGCHECGEPMLYSVEGYNSAARELVAEFFGVGTSYATLSASRRSWASWVYLAREGRKQPRDAYHGLMLALDEEQMRRFTETWTEHLKTVSDEMLELMADEEFRVLADAELEAIIWPSSDAKVC
jgi:hypothetical protein